MTPKVKFWTVFRFFGGFALFGGLSVVLKGTSDGHKLSFKKKFVKIGPVENHL